MDYILTTTKREQLVTNLIATGEKIGLLWGDTVYRSSNNQVWSVSKTTATYLGYYDDFQRKISRFGVKFKRIAK